MPDPTPTGPHRTESTRPLNLWYLAPMSNIGAVRRAESKALQNDGKIDAAEAKAIALAAGKKDKAALKVAQQILATDAFEPPKGKQLKELQKLLGVTKLPTHDPLAGSKIGEVTVTKNLGPKQGYDSKYQAYAQAQLAHSSMAAVVQDAKGKWHPVLANKWASSDQSGGGNSLHSLPAPKGSSTLKGLYDNVKNAQTKETRDAAVKELVAATYGIDPKEVNVITSADDRRTDRLNVNVSDGEHELLAQSADGRMGAAKSHENFDPTAEPAIEISLEAWVDGATGKFAPDEALITVDHEAIHQQHYKLAQEWYSKFKGQTKVPDFDEYLRLQPESKISKADAKTIGGLVEGGLRLATTEARAHLGGAMDAMKLGRTADGAAAIANYAYLLKKPKLDKPADAAIEQLSKELKATYQGLDDDQRATLKQVLQVSGKGTWLADVKLE